MSASIPMSVGDPDAQRRFIESHKEFLQEFPTLQNVIEEAFRLSEEKCYPESQNGPKPGLTDEDLAMRVVHYLERAVFDDFGELLILAGNGMGIGAKKILRSIYERLVTTMYIAMFPAEARVFLENAEIEKGKVLKRAHDSAPELVSKDFTPEQLARAEDKKKAAEAKKKSEQCSKCKQPITEEAWTRVSLDAMAKKVDDGLLKLYGPCYLVPTYLTHATPFGMDLQFRQTDSGPEAHAHGAVWRGHYLILWLIRHQDTYFNLGLTAKVDARCSAFSAIWPEDTEVKR